MTVVLDTDVASLLIKQRLPAWLTARLDAEPLCITFVTLAELTQWAELRRWGTARRASLHSWLDEVPVLPGSEAVASRWGAISANARRRGRPRPQNDTWVAACCLEYELPLATRNTKDFDDFVQHEGLIVIGS
ncbi:MAG TPA: type II toxin-antitoxin system VapC family toxin [Jatrophihabitantaceae bacterium]